MNILKPPNPDKIPKIFNHHGVQRVDNYFWMRDDSRKSLKVINHLESENFYTESWFKSGKDNRKEIFQEIIDRIPKKEDSVPIKMGTYDYFRRFKPDNEYPIYIRREIGSLKEKIILDVNKLAQKKDFYQLANWSISPSEDLMAFAEDEHGRRQYVIKIKDLRRGTFLKDNLRGTSGDIAWSENGNILFYVYKDPQTLLPFQVYRHVLGEPQSKDILVYEEKDPTFHLSVGNSRSMKYIEIEASSTNSSETLLIESLHPIKEPKVIKKREEKHLYTIEHDGDRFLILTNWKAKNFRLMETNINDSENKSKWRELLPHRKEVLVQSFLCFPKNIVVIERKDGLRRIRILDSDGKSQHLVNFDDPSYSAYFAANPEYNVTEFYFGYSSLRTPDSIYSVNLKKGRKKLLKQLEVKGLYSPERYRVKRLNILSRDKKLIPVSLVYKKNTFKKGKNPLFVYGYGSYGISVDPSFSSTRISLLDRGFVFAIAHVRGGQELGRQWYEEGKMFKKKNTFNDFIDVTKGLIDLGYVDQKKVFAGGGSAGGLLIGSVINMEPELYKGIISNVPFVDIMTTMLDPTIPLTTGEYEEWGNPLKKDEFSYMLSYSPYDNIDSLVYPSLLVTTGLWDSQVQYYEPAKYVAKLRDLSLSDNPILLNVDLSSGHSGKSGRFASLQEVAMEYAFLLRINEDYD